MEPLSSGLGSLIATRLRNGDVVVGRLEITGFKEYERALRKDRTISVLKKHVSKATLKNANILEVEFKRHIKQGIPSPNAPLTVWIKRSANPLVDTGLLLRNITVKQQGWKTAFVGVQRNNRRHWIAEILEGGTRIRVTPKMRAMFYYLWLASNNRIPRSQLKGRALALWKRRPGGWRRLSPGKRFIKIPPRPFIKPVMEQRALIERFMQNWRDAVDRSLREIAEKG